MRLLRVSKLRILTKLKSIKQCRKELSCMGVNQCQSMKRAENTGKHHVTKTYGAGVEV
jgi:hypothetical protein